MIRIELTEAEARALLAAWAIEESVYGETSEILMAAEEQLYSAEKKLKDALANVPKISPEDDFRK